MAHDSIKLSYWTEHYLSWRSSGLSQRSYCQREGLSFSSFDHWRRRAREAAGVIPPTVPPHPLDKPMTLVPVQLDLADGLGDIQLHSPAGWRITLPAALGREVVVQLLLQLP